jgi:MipA family protein
MKKIHYWLTLGTSLLAFNALADETTKPNSFFKGDVGVALFHAPAITQTTDSANAVLPYVFGETDHLFGRLDTFGVKLMPMGSGNLELSARISFEGYHSSIAGIQDRARPLPVGVSTFQQGDWGAALLHAFYDDRSGGTLLDGTYAAMFSVGKVNFYPQIGIERRSQSYVQALYGVSATEHTASQVAAFQASAATSPNVALNMEYPINERYSLNFYAKKKWLGSIADSPLVNTKTQTTAFIALTRSFD